MSQGQGDARNTREFFLGQKTDAADINMNDCPLSEYLGQLRGFD